MKLSVMTLNMLFPAMFKFSIDPDEEDFEEYYDEMMQIVSDCGYKAVDVCFETTVLPTERIMAILNKYSLKVSSYIHMGAFAAEKDCSEQIEKAKAAADLAATLGTKVLMLAPQAHDGIETCPTEEIQDPIGRTYINKQDYFKSYFIIALIVDVSINI
ncbi:MAG: hypothetical protein LIP11_15085 [Clostridiales bacterium]|nr:hypothetical protein [Clostridiales bacterium]